jgi:hypothetical protein
MPKFVVYEVWTSAKVIEAETMEDAYLEGRPEPKLDLNLCNWHIVEIKDGPSK